MIIKIGYYDWHEFGEQEAFYPDDIPSDWRLTFYANEFECTQIDVSTVQTVDEQFEDLPEQFDLLLRVQNDEQWPVVQSLLDNAELNVKALMCAKDYQPQWAKRLAPYSVSCFSHADALEFKSAVTTNAKQWVDDTANILAVNETLSLKQWRTLVDEWVGQSEQENGYLMLDAKVIKPSLASELRLMMDMMGY